MPVLFISDLHLDAERPAATNAFLTFLQQDAAQASRLYVLGDLFEAWVRDDDPNPHHRKVLEALGQLAAQGTECYFMRGNRDFLMGQSLVESFGIRFLPDPTLISVKGESILLSHGDAFCTDDHAYQRFRRITRHPLTIAIYSALPVALQTAIVAGARNQSQASTAYKAADIMDVNADAVNAALRDFGVATLLHGHTHRPDIHEFELDGKAARRIVLGDWYEAGSVLRWDENGPRLTALSYV